MSVCPLDFGAIPQINVFRKIALRLSVNSKEVKIGGDQFSGVNI